MKGFTDTTDAETLKMTADHTYTVKMLCTYAQGKVSPQDMRKVITDLLVKLGSKGLFRIMGFRKTVAS